MKLRFLAVVPMLMFGAAHADHGWKEDMVKGVFGEKKEMTEEEFVNHAKEKFKKIDVSNKKKITPEEFLKYVEDEKTAKMKAKYCK